MVGSKEGVNDSVGTSDGIFEGESLGIMDSVGWKLMVGCDDG